MKRVSLIFFSFFISWRCYSQKMEAPSGLYQGGLVSSDFYPTNGYYFFYKDSGFVFVRTKKHAKTSTPDNLCSISDSIISIGTGSWHIDENLFVIKFDNCLPGAVVGSRLQYKSNSGLPYDSLKVKIKISNQIKKTPHSFFISTEPKAFGGMTDSLGTKTFTLPMQSKLPLVVVSHPDFESALFYLIPGNNIHDITIELASKSLPQNFVLRDVSYAYRVKGTTGKQILFRDRRFIKLSENNTVLIELLKNNIDIYPTQIGILNILINVLAKRHSY